MRHLQAHDSIKHQRYVTFGLLFYFIFCSRNLTYVICYVLLCFPLFCLSEWNLLLFQVLDKMESSATRPPLRRTLIHFRCCCPDWYATNTPSRHLSLIYLCICYHIYIFIYLYIYIFMYLSHPLYAYTISRFGSKVPHALVDHTESYLRNHDPLAPNAEHFTENEGGYREVSYDSLYNVDFLTGTCHPILFFPQLKSLSEVTNGTMDVPTLQPKRAAHHSPSFVEHDQSERKARLGRYPQFWW